jgi:hypothetical protein
MSGAVTFRMNIDRSKLDALQTKFSIAARQAVIDAAHGFEAGAKTKAPYLTGTLKNSIHVSFAHPHLAHIKDATAYGLRQEFEHKTKAGYFRNTAADIAPKFFDALQRILQNL